MLKYSYCRVLMTSRAETFSSCDPSLMQLYVKGDYQDLEARALRQLTLYKNGMKLPFASPVIASRSLLLPG
jgi:hypothetical protein